VKHYEKGKEKPIEQLKRHSKKNIHKHKLWKVMMCWKHKKNKMQNLVKCLVWLTLHWKEMTERKGQNEEKNNDSLM
jgi:hypothetical protein